MVSQGGEIGVNKIVSELLDVVDKVYSSVNSMSSKGQMSLLGDDPPPVRKLCNRTFGCNQLFN